MIPTARRARKLSRGYYLAAGLLLGLAATATVYLAGQLRASAAPEDIAYQFFVETYRHDFAAAWELVSSADQAARSKQEYVTSQPQVGSELASLYDQLSGWGDFQVLSLVSGQPDQMIVTAQIRFPNSSQPELLELFADAQSAAERSEQVLDRLQSMYDRGEIQFVEGDISVNLVREERGWRVVQHWGTALTVRLSATVSPNLPWEFYPVEQQVQALPGQLVKASYIARNDSDRTITAKAVHQVGPPSLATYFQTIQCFCFTEQTLEPGEQREMVLLFQIDPGVPAGVGVLHNRYAFYTLNEFPGEAEPDEQ